MISFAPTEEQEIARATAADFARSVLSASARAADEAAALPAPLLAAAWALGLVQAIADAEPGSLEQPTVLNALMLEELARGDAAAAVAIAAPLGFVKAVAEQGTEGQRRELLPLFAGDAPQSPTSTLDGSRAPPDLRWRLRLRVASGLKGRKR
jgi:alkylation response protein AidB-like acyl-CoA dehydrogenase